MTRYNLALIFKMFFFFCFTFVNDISKRLIESNMSLVCLRLRPPSRFKNPTKFILAAADEMHLIHVSDADTQFSLYEHRLWKRQIKTHFCATIWILIWKLSAFPCNLFDITYIQRQWLVCSGKSGVSLYSHIFLFCSVPDLLPPSVDWIKIMHTHQWISIQPINCAQINSTQTNYFTDKTHYTPHHQHTTFGYQHEIKTGNLFGIAHNSVQIGGTKSVKQKIRVAEIIPEKCCLCAKRICVCCMRSDDSIRFLQTIVTIRLPPVCSCVVYRWALRHLILFLLNPILSVQRYRARFRHE